GRLRDLYETREIDVARRFHGSATGRRGGLPKGRDRHGRRGAAPVPADIAVAITGVAGPGTDEDHNPVGRVCYAVAESRQATRSVERQYGRESRETIQEMAMADALQEVLRILRESSPADGAD